MKQTPFKSKTLAEVKAKQKEALAKKKAKLAEKKIKAKEKKKEKSLPKVLWTLVSRFIRDRDGNKCITCSKTSTKKGGIHAGHFIPSAVGGALLRYHPMNISSQCFCCNVNLGGYGSVYYVKMVDKYGQRTVDKMMMMKHQAVKVDSYFYNTLIELYKQGYSKKIEQEIIKFIEAYL